MNGGDATQTKARQLDMSNKRPYLNTTFNGPTLAALFTTDPGGVLAEAEARGATSGLARKLARVLATDEPTVKVSPVSNDETGLVLTPEQENINRVLALITPPKAPKVPVKRGDEFTATRKEAWAIAVASGLTGTAKSELYRSELANRLSPEDLERCFAQAAAARKGRRVEATV
jgi:hypothetical protein